MRSPKAIAANASLRTRLAVILALLAIVSVIPVGISIYLTARHAMTTELDESIEAFVARIRSSPNNFGSGLCGNTANKPWVQNGRNSQSASSSNMGVSAQCFSADGKLLGSFGANVSTAPPDHHAAVKSPVGPVTQRIDGVAYRVIEFPVENGNHLRVMRDLFEVNAAMNALRPRIIATGVVATIFATTVGWLVARRETVSMGNLTKIAQEIAEVGRPLPQMAVGGASNNEVDKLTRAFASMVQALARSQDQQQQLMQDAGHELRTPITSIRMNVGTLKRYGDLDAQTRQRLLDDIESEAIELTNLVNEVVAMSSDEFIDEEMQDVDFADIARRAAARTERLTGRKVELHAEPFVFPARPGRVMRAMSNLLENAAKFSPPDKPIEFTIRPPIIEIRDYGPGIPPGDLERVFDRFYRSADARCKPGSGLGLAIVKKIVTDRGATIRAENAEGGGARIVVDMSTASEQ